ncbi:N-acetyltransferase [Fructilactobacillus ixorae]|uniref:N-acetyltransferase n=1 Tax=Fructilactobacillus ixorae TaxID=1750535 RepID=A0ABY5C5E4_9LACO|nr:GNAT family N-acetyltransferase [Fructilactobacillus ixorae]USS93413.1 N-acetyltransferase [Fructilactobacillus ixorae]
MSFLFEPGRFYQNDAAGQLVAEVTFTVTDDVLAVNHTFVAPSLRGQGIASQLMVAVAEYAREQHDWIKPVCSYSQRFFQRADQYHDLIKE